MRAILTVIGRDKVGIIAGVSTKLAELNINIIDVSQTIMEDYFTMMMMLSFNKQEVDFDNIRKELNALGETLGVKINVQNEEIFNTMHKL
ncbi:ACT domain-containing protein [Enterococcus sp. PF1-24]|uniref:ACT domain-containing protein n=1 Tax=unclassified Enterococcus TaxID=2608891 RepID=UPI0024744478|nr:MULTISPECIES: ACT domain-containing protein [unclassified Enterococcus]MDH6365477.1 ACT domain-containing protein [Enterococcus sp. PFB1-1]MDH6402569.1 ACT domain-containing protein [Enterococcus sp. PF1-24]